VRKPDAEPLQAVSRLGLLSLIAAVILSSSFVVLLIVWHFAPSKRVSSDYALVYLPVVQRPATVSSEVAALPDDAVVIGVEAGGRSRAYLLKAFFYPAARHVINDLLGGRPISIAYCDMTDCVAAYTDPDADEPLDITTGGWQGHSVPGGVEGSMLLRVGNSWYRQDTGQPLAIHATTPFPYTRSDFVRTDWKQWHETHPDTDVYVGE
jgi:hypothetical protein